MANGGVELMLVVVGAIILLGFFGQLIFRKTDVPSTLWLILFGFLLSQVIPVIDRPLLTGFAGFAGALAIIILLFDGGMALKIEEVATSMRFGFMLLIASLLVSGISVTAVMYGFGYDILISVLMASILAGTSAAIVIPVVTKMRGLTEKAKSILSLESIADNFSLVAFFVTLDVIQLASTNYRDIVVQVANNLLIGFALGAIVAALWFPVIARIKFLEQSYAATLSVLIFLYVVTEFLGGSGGIACFVAGMVLVNIGPIVNRFDFIKEKMSLDLDTQKYHGLISFFVRTFFFVYLGVVVTLANTEALLIGGALVLALLVGRLITVKLISSRVKELTPFDKRVMGVMFPRGLSTAVLALLPMSMGIPGTEFFADIAFVVILGTVALSTIGVYFARKSRPPKSVDHAPPHNADPERYRVEPAGYEKAID